MPTHLRLKQPLAIGWPWHDVIAEELGLAKRQRPAEITFSDQIRHLQHCRFIVRLVAYDSSYSLLFCESMHFLSLERCESKRLFTIYVLAGT